MRTSYSWCGMTKGRDHPTLNRRPATLTTVVLKVRLNRGLQRDWGEY